MEEKGLIRRTADENDQRTEVTATEKGRELNSLVQAAFQEAEAVMVKGLRLEETEALRLLLYRVIENLEEDRSTMLKTLWPHARPYSKWICRSAFCAARRRRCLSC